MYTSILALAVKVLLSLPVSLASEIEQAAGSGNPFTSGSANDKATKVDIVFTAGSYAKPVAKMIITTGYSARKGPMGNEPAVIHITAGYLKTIGEGPGGELTFYSSE